jgi:hypothetical protein
MIQKKSEQIIKDLQDEVARLTALIEQLKSEIHTANLERFKRD